MTYTVKRLSPLLECLSERAMPSVTFAEPVDGTLVIYGDQRANDIEIIDDGTANADALVIQVDGVEVDTGLDGPFSTIRVLSGGGQDNVRYTLTGDLSTARSIDVFLGNHHDAFTADLHGNVVVNGDLEIRAYGGNGHDRLSLNALNVEIAEGASLSADFWGGNGMDTLDFNYSGLLSGSASFFAQGGNGKDDISGRFVLSETSDPEPAPSSGSLSVDFRGGNGVDRMAVSVDGASADNPPAVAVFGGLGMDTFVVSNDEWIVDPQVKKKKPK